MQIQISLSACKSEAAANPAVVERFLNSWTSRLERMKAKPKTAARKQRMIDAKARIKELKAALKSATKKASTKAASPKLKKADAPVVKKKSKLAAKAPKEAKPKARTPKAEYKDARKELDRNKLSPTRQALSDTYHAALKAHVDAKDTGNKKLIAAAKKKRVEAMEAMKAHTTENINRLNAAKKVLNIK